MKTDLTRSVLTLCLALMSIQGLMCQDLSFHQFTQLDHQGDGPANWTAAGRVRLTKHDLIVFDPKVAVQVASEVCAINLRSCVQPGQAPPPSTPCYCTQVSDQDFDLYLSAADDLPLTDHRVQATVPSRYFFNPLSLMTTVGSLRLETKEVRPSDDCCHRVQMYEQSLDIERQALETMMGELKGSRELKLQLLTMEKELKKANEAKSQLVLMEAELKNAESQLASQNTMIKSLTNMVAELSKDNKRHDEMTSQIAELMSDVSNHSHQIVAAPDTCLHVHSLDPRPLVTLDSGMEVVCDTITDGGGWIVIQRRVSPEINFYRDWLNYKYGFGDLKGSFWMGLEKVHRLTINQQFELRVDLAFGGKNYHAQYHQFTVMGEQEKYKLVVANYSGDAGDSFTSHNGMAFTTKDRDNDINPGGNCAQAFTGAWWYNKCHSSNLNGAWGAADNKGIRWWSLTGEKSASFSEMKIRKVYKS